MDDPSSKKYPMPLTATKQWNVEVGRIRENDIFGEYGLDLFVCGDQVPYIHTSLFQSRYSIGKFSLLLLIINYLNSCCEELL